MLAPGAGALFALSYINIETCYDTPHLATEQAPEYQALRNDPINPPPQYVTVEDHNLVELQVQQLWR